MRNSSFKRPLYLFKNEIRDNNLAESHNKITNNNDSDYFKEIPIQLKDKTKNTSNDKVSIDYENLKIFSIDSQQNIDTNKQIKPEDLKSENESLKNIKLKLEKDFVKSGRKVDFFSVDNDLKQFL